MVDEFEYQQRSAYEQIVMTNRILERYKEYIEGKENVSEQEEEYYNMAEEILKSISRITGSTKFKTIDEKLSQIESDNSERFATLMPEIRKSLFPFEEMGINKKSSVEQLDVASKKHEIPKDDIMGFLHTYRLEDISHLNELGDWSWDDKNEPLRGSVSVQDLGRQTVYMYEEGNQPFMDWLKGVMDDLAARLTDGRGGQ